MKQETRKPEPLELDGWFISPELLELSHNAELAYAMADTIKAKTADTTKPIAKEGRKA